jgi:hypothetical protein
MKQVWIAAISINLVLGFCFLCCLRLFNLCIKYTGALKGLYDEHVAMDDADDEADEAQSGSRSDMRRRAAVESIRNIRRLQAQRIAESRRMWLPRTVSAWIALMIIIFDACAFAAFSFAASSPISSFDHHSTPEIFVMVVRTVAKAILLQFTEESFAYTFWTAVALAFIALPVSIYVIVKDSSDNTFMAVLSQILGSVLLFPISSTILSVLSCDYDPRHSAPVLAAYPQMLCWHQEHIIMVSVGLAVFVLYYTVVALMLARLIRAIIDDKSQILRDGGSTAIYFDNRFTVFYFQAKVCTAFVVAYWGTGRYTPWIVIIAIFVLLLGLMSYNVHSRPSNIDVLNSLRTYSLAFALVINVCACISIVTENRARVGHWLVLAGTIGWAIVCFSHYVTQYGGCPECQLFEPPDDNVADQLVRARDAEEEGYGGGGGDDASSDNSTSGGVGAGRGGYAPPRTPGNMSLTSHQQQQQQQQLPFGAVGANGYSTFVAPGSAPRGSLLSSAAAGGGMTSPGGPESVQLDFTGAVQRHGYTPRGGRPGAVSGPAGEGATVAAAAAATRPGSRLMYVNLSAASKDPIVLI